MKAQALRAQAAQDRAAASASRIGGYVGAGATLLTGGWRASGGFGLGGGSAGTGAKINPGGVGINGRLGPI